MKTKYLPILFLLTALPLFANNLNEEFLKAKAIYSEYLPPDHGILSYIDSLVEGS